MTKNDLEQLTLLNSEISRDLERLQELYALLTGCTSSISGLPHIGLLRGSDRTDKFISMIDVLEQQIKERVLNSAALYVQIWAYINTIHDPLVRLIISLRYIDGLPWQQVANNIGGGISVSGVRMILDRYLAANTGQQQEVSP